MLWNIVEKTKLCRQVIETSLRNAVMISKSNDFTLWYDSPSFFPVDTQIHQIAQNSRCINGTQKDGSNNGCCFAYIVFCLIRNLQLGDLGVCLIRYFGYLNLGFCFSLADNLADNSLRQRKRSR